MTPMMRDKDVRARRSERLPIQVRDWVDQQVDRWSLARGVIEWGFSRRRRFVLCYAAVFSVLAKGASIPITATMLYDLVHCPHRVTMDLFGDPAERDEVSPFVQLLWERGSLFEKEVIEGIEVPYVDLSQYAGEEKERLTLAAMERGEPLIYGGRISAGDLLGDPDLLRLEGDGYVAGDIKSGAGEESTGDDEGLQSRIDPDRLVFLDEIWTKTNMAPLRGWVPRGQRLRAKVPHRRWKTTNFLVALREDRIAAPWLLDGLINGETLLLYVETVLVATLEPGTSSHGQSRPPQGQGCAPRHSISRRQVLLPA